MSGTKSKAPQPWYGIKEIWKSKQEKKTLNPYYIEEKERKEGNWKRIRKERKEGKQKKKNQEREGEISGEPERFGLHTPLYGEERTGRKKSCSWASILRITIITSSWGSCHEPTSTITTPNNFQGKRRKRTMMHYFLPYVQDKMGTLGSWLTIYITLFIRVLGSGFRVGSGF